MTVKSVSQDADFQIPVKDHSYRHLEHHHPPHITALNLPLPSAALAMDGTQEAQTALALSVGLSRAFLLSRGGEVL